MGFHVKPQKTSKQIWTGIKGTVLDVLRLLGWSRGSRQTFYGCQEIMGAQQPRSPNRAMLSAGKRLTDFFAPRVPEPFFKHRAALCGLQSRGGAQEALSLDGRRNRTSVAREAMELKASPTAAMIPNSNTTFVVSRPRKQGAHFGDHKGAQQMDSRMLHTRL